MSNNTSHFYITQASRTSRLPHSSILATNKIPIITRQLAFNITYDNPSYPVPDINLTDEVNLDNEILFRSVPNISNTSRTIEIHQDKKVQKNNKKT